MRRTSTSTAQLPPARPHACVLRFRVLGVYVLTCTFHQHKMVNPMMFSQLLLVDPPDEVLER